ncbi:MAG: type IV pili twitching motility protein PilT, partial [Hydrocarboniphaga effusa]|nr:type IV pili twitching motility protein PilT [Hydrocarboniphaga effusa]
FQLFESNAISYDEAVRNADSQNEVRLRIKPESKRARQTLQEDDVVKQMQTKEEEKSQMMRR